MPCHPLTHHPQPPSPTSTLIVLRQSSFSLVSHTWRVSFQLHQANSLGTLGCILSGAIKTSNKEVKFSVGKKLDETP